MNLNTKRNHWGFEEQGDIDRFEFTDFISIFFVD
jgi:hypothetical protein